MSPPIDFATDVVWARIPSISTAHTFGVHATHNLREKIEATGIAFTRECRVLEVCNPRHAATVLYQSISISTASPGPRTNPRRLLPKK